MRTIHVWIHEYFEYIPEISMIECRALRSCQAHLLNILTGSVELAK